MHNRLDDYSGESRIYDVTDPLKTTFKPAGYQPAN